MGRLIDADKLIDDLSDLKRSPWANTPCVSDERKLGIIEALDMIQSIVRVDSQTVDDEPVRHGAWLPCDKKGYILTEMALRDGRRWYGYKCSECNNIYHGNVFTKYCPNCGAKMDEERKEE